jgi:large subunit ribosomal protein L17
MRNQKDRHKMGRSQGHRKRTLQHMSQALIDKKRIQTTVAKAKALRPFFEPLVTRAKEDTTHNRRQAFRHLQDKSAVRELFDEVAVEVGDRPGGYTRIIKLGRRSGDGAERAMIELVDYGGEEPQTGSDRRRTRRGSGGGAGSRSRSTPQGPQPGRDEPEPEEERAAADEATTAEGDAQQTGSGADPSGQSQGKPEASATETTDQQESLGGEEKASVEAPVPEEQKEPVPDRTEAKDEAASAKMADPGEEAEEPGSEEEAAGDDTDEDEQNA